MYYYAIISDFDAALSYANDAIAYFESHPYYSRKSLEIFAILAITLQIEKGEFQKARNLIDRYLPKKGTYNYYKCLQQKALLFLQSEEYESAYNFANQQSTYKATESFKQEWKIIRAYTHALAELGAFEVDEKFKLGKLLNEIDLWSKDKSGQNLNLIILEILFRYARNDIRIHDRVLAWRRYLMTHLKKNERSYIFIKGLLKWIDSSFSCDFTDVKQKLEKTKPYSIDLEIIPYPKIIEILEKSNIS